MQRDRQVLPMRVAVLYEHPEWFLPLFGALARRGLAYEPVHAASLRWDPAERPSYSLLINRMSPSAYLRGHGHAIFAAAAYLEYVESSGIPVVNGLAAYRLEISKAAQVSLFERLGVRYPATHVINSAAAAPQAARGLRFPVVVKPNIGGSGARIQRFEDDESLAACAAEGTLDLGIDQTALVQEWLPARGGAITRVELLEQELLYGIRITPPSGHGFNLCPADICREEEGGGGEAVPGPTAGMCPARPAMQIESAAVPASIVEGARAIASAGRLDVCGIEYLIDSRDGEAYFYDVNALSNFVTDAPRIVGFDPFDRFAAYIQRRLS
jgi:hypothetical protein